MEVKPLVRCLGDGLKEGEVVLGGDNGNMAHVGAEGRQAHLDVDTGSIPAKEGMNREREPEVMDSWEAAVGGPDPRPAEELPHQDSEAATGVALEPAMAVKQQGCFTAAGKARTSALHQVLSHLEYSVAGERKEPGLVEFRVSDEESLLLRIVVAEREFHELPASESGRVEEHNSKSGDLAVKRRKRAGIESLGGSQETRDLALGEYVRCASWLGRRELAWIRHEAARFGSPPV